MSGNVHIDTVTETTTQTFEYFSIAHLYIDTTASTATVTVTLIDTDDGTTKNVPYVFTGTDYSAFFDNAAFFNLIASRLGTTVIS